MIFAQRDCPLCDRVTEIGAIAQPNLADCERLYHHD
jgi:hypothetical protein